MDSEFNKNYFKQSNYNIVNTGTGDDYVLYCGEKNIIDTGNGNDYALSIDSITRSAVTNAENVRDYLANGDDNSIDGTVSSFNQGTYGGDCRLLALLDGIVKRNSFSNYIGIDKDGDNYTVTFKKFTGNNSVTFSSSDFEDFKNVFGDKDIVLADFALNKLLKQNEDSNPIYEDMSYVEAVSYNMLAKYIFGTDKITVALMNHDDQQAAQGKTYNYRTRFEEMWELYQNNTLSNLTVGIYEGQNDYRLGIIAGHAYSVKAMDSSHISLVNVWDSKDVLNLDLDKFYSLTTNVYSYGSDYYGEDTRINNVPEAVSSPVFELGNSINELKYDTINWITNISNTEIDFAPVNNNDNILKELAIYYTDKVN